MSRKSIDVLLIDDDWPTNYLHEIIIEETGLNIAVEAVESSQEALALLQQQYQAPPDLVLLDINMPRINGWEFLERFKAIKHDHTVLYMLTTSNYQEDKEKAKANGLISGYINKPLTKAILEEIMEKHFAKSE